MVWVWDDPTIGADFSAQFDDETSVVVHSLSRPHHPLPENARVVFKSTSGVKRFQKYHCPPFESWPVVDETWKEIISEFVAPGHVQFFPVELRARSEVCRDFFWMIPLCVFPCLDLKKSKFHHYPEVKEWVAIYAGGPWVFKDDCLAGAHLARDFNFGRLIIVSDELRDALAATGEEYLFRRGDDFGRPKDGS